MRPSPPISDHPLSTISNAQLFKDWDIWTQFVNQYTNRALQLDSLETSHPIEVPVQRSSQVNEIFDEISYCKGAACIMMITSYLGMDMFRKGICAYLEKHKYGNARTDDLWAALSETSGKDVKGFMGVWTKEVGYPVVSLSRAEGKLVLQQARFLMIFREPISRDISYYNMFRSEWERQGGTMGAARVRP